MSGIIRFGHKREVPAWLAPPGTRPIRRTLMDTRSVTRPTLPSTRSLLTGAHLCDQVSALLLIEAKATRQAFLGEPVEEVMAMTQWAIKHEGEADFDTEKILLAWARKRGRGYWRTEDRRVEECGYCHGTGRVPGPFKKADEWNEEREGVECPRRKGSRIGLKALKLLSEGEVGG
jgi:hypothetical protein